MTQDRWQQVKQIFNSAVELAGAERHAFLDSACGDNQGLRREVESLIAAHEEDGSFIDSPAYEVAVKLIGDDEAALQAGEILGHYQIQSLLGKGGMGQVYLAEDTRLRRKVALKFLSSYLTRDHDRLRRFEHEARSASGLNHPNIVTIYEIGEVDGRSFIAMEHIAGETIRQRIEHTQLKLGEVLNIGEQIASALAAAHAAGIVHRDIKPENIMLRQDSYVKVLDFGLAKLTESRDSGPEDPTQGFVRTSAGIVMGTVSYMSPEQARGLTVDARTDLWSLGVVLYEMTTGNRPFTGPTNSDVMVSILEREPVSLLNISEMPEALEWIVTKALMKEREDRYQTAREMLTDLRRLKERLVVDAAIGRSVSPHPDKLREPLQPDESLLPSITASIQPAKTDEQAISPPLETAEIRNRRWGFRLVTALAALAVAAAMVYVGFKLVRRDSASVPTDSTGILSTTQITFSTGLDQYPSLSPDGNSIAYSSDQSGNFEIYVKQLTPGGREIQLTSDGQHNLQPAWSPDGQRIAFYSKGRGGIWIMPALGGSAKQLTDFGSRPAWSRDGATIAFQSGLPSEAFSAQAMAPSTIWIMSSDGGKPRQITQQGTPAGGHSSASWSPDGKDIAFQTSDFIFSSVWSVSVAGGQVRRLAAGGDPVYAPNGREVYIRGSGNESGLSRVRLSPTGEQLGEPELIATAGPGVGMRSPTVSADGKRIAYTVARGSSSLWSISLSNGTASPPIPFARDTSYRNNLARFSHDGRRLAITKWRPRTSADIWLADADGKNLTQLTTNSAADSQPNWFPGDDRIAFISNRDNTHPALWSISLTTGREEPLLDLGEGVEFAVLSPDGKQVAFNSKKSGAVNVWTALLADGVQKQLTFSEKELMGFPCWSRDGQLIAFETQNVDDAYLMIIPATGGQPTQLTSTGKAWPHSWSPDGDKIAFAGQYGGVWNIYWISRSTKAQQKLSNYTKLNAFVRYPEWSPLGNQIVYEYAEITGNIWLMELK
jgi:eukaryotic-like serine/threonine-protein kinase